MSTIIYNNEHPEIKKAFETLSRVGLLTLNNFDVDIVKISTCINQLEAQLVEAQAEIGQLNMYAKLQDSKYREYTKHKEAEEQKLREKLAVVDTLLEHYHKQAKGGTNDNN